MPLPEATTHSFIIRVWLDDLDETTGRTTWHGHIIHVPSQGQRYVNNFVDIEQFIQPFLQINPHHGAIVDE